MPIDVRHQLTGEQVGAVVELARRAEEADGVSPLNDDARLALQRTDQQTHHLLAVDGPDLLGYALLRQAQDEDRATGLVVVDPDRRRLGLGRRLLDTVTAATDEPVGFWSFHALPAAAALAKSAGLAPVRELLVLGRDLDAPVDARPAPAGTTLRAFVPGRDEQAWLTVNARAFAHHPEQGRMTLADLQARMAEDWFDPADFLLATDAGTGALLGFHWTKRHDATTGEVYVLAVDPDHDGRGLGTVLLLAGLHHLRSRGITRVILYVEAAEAGPVHLYRRHGFDTVTRDVMYAAQDPTQERTHES